MVEEWRSVYGFLGLYEVSNLGRVRSIRGRYGMGKILRPKLPENVREYLAVSLHDGSGKRLRRSVHSLVAHAFLRQKPSPEHEVRHLDGNRENCVATNLAWGTRKENAEDRERHGNTARGNRHGMFGRPQRGEDNGQSILTATMVVEIRSLSGTLSQRAIASQFSVTQGAVWRIIHRKAWAHVA